jgi:transposase, IS5 family
VKDRFGLMKFLELHVGDAIPDARTIWDFKQALERDGRNGAERLFERFDQILTDGGMIGRKGSIVDASFVDAPRQRNSRKETNKSRRVKGRKDLKKEVPRDGIKIVMRVGRRRTRRRTMGTRIMQKWMPIKSW